MGHTVTVQHPHFPEGTVFNVGGLDRVPNGSSIEIDEETERLFVMSHGRTIEDSFKNDAVVSVSGKSAIDSDELSQLVELYGPQPEEVVIQDEPVEEETPSWMSPPNTSQEDGDD